MGERWRVLAWWLLGAAGVGGVLGAAAAALAPRPEVAGVRDAGPEAVAGCGEAESPLARCAPPGAGGGGRPSPVQERRRAFSHPRVRR